MLDRILSIVAPPRCAACDARLLREAVFCAACLATLEAPPPLPAGVTASFAYGGALADAIRACKFRGRVDRLRLLARLIVVRLPPVAIDAVVPVPLHVRRLRERGFDQAALLARAVARVLEAPLSFALERTRETPHLAQLSSGDRRAAIADAFVARPCGRVLLIDDVYTTGATLGAAADAVRRAGGAPIGHVLAATPRE